MPVKTIDPTEVAGRAIDPSEVAGPAETLPAPSFNDRLTQPVSDEYFKQHPILGTMSNFGGGAINAAEQMVAHPYNTVRDTVHLAQDVGNVLMPDAQTDEVNAASKARLQQMWEEAKKHPAYTAGGLVGGAVAGEGVGAVAGRVGSIVPRAAKAIVEKTTGTGPRAVEDFIDTTKAKNEASVADAAKKNQILQDKADMLNQANQGRYGSSLSNDALKRQQKVREVGKARIDTQKANDAAAAKQTRKLALERGVQELSSDKVYKSRAAGAQRDLADTHANVKSIADQKYNTLAETLNDEPAPMHEPTDAEGNISGEPVDLLEHLSTQAADTMKGSETETPVMKDINKKLKARAKYEEDSLKAEMLGKEQPEPPEPLTYKDLQGYRSEIGKELSRGTLLGDVYQSYKGMLKTIDSAMEKIAARHGMEGNLKEAQNFYSQYADAFLDPKSPLKKAINHPESAESLKFFKGMDESGIEQLAKYNPELARRINTIRKYAAEAKGTKVPDQATDPKPLPKLPPKPVGTRTAPPPVTAKTVTPNITQLGPEDIATAKKTFLKNKARGIDEGGHPIANAATGINVARNVVSLNPTGIAKTLAARGLYGIGGQALAGIMEHPAVAEFLARPTEANLQYLASQPPEMVKANVQPLIEAANQRRMQVSPKLMRLVVGSAGTLPKGHALSSSQPQ